MTLTMEEMDKLCSLAALKLTSEEKQIYSVQLDSIMGYVAQLDELDLQGDLSSNQSQTLGEAATQIPTYHESQKLLSNSQHHLHNQSIVIKS